MCGASRGADSGDQLQEVSCNIIYVKGASIMLDMDKGKLIMSIE